MVRAGLARRAVAVVRPQVWVVDDTGFPKDGIASPGVACQHVGPRGKVGNCQISVSVHAVSDARLVSAVVADVPAGGLG
ncbi:transposase [Actinacidiphila glaucinigra]|uniref:transposase n=1 Tax=Actinacidiphila glaucinigra TaxID=235986 RepID=UPI0037895DEA